MLRRRGRLGVLVLLAAGLGLWMSVPQTAYAARQGMPSISAGGYHACAIQGGKAYCWGDNQYGELGDGSTSSSRVPVAVDTSGVLAGKTLTQIAVGTEDYEDTCALDSTGKAYCWGDNQGGGLGDGSTTSSRVPVAVDTRGVLAGKTLTQIAAGEAMCALDSTGKGYCWGWNGSDQLGDGSTAEDSTVPVAIDTRGVLAGKALTKIAAGVADTCALDSSGAAYCWGAGVSLGDGGNASSDVPVAVDTGGVLAGKTLTEITVGDGDTCVLDDAGAAYCWGYNYYGELGDGSYGGNYEWSSDVPVAVVANGALAGKALTQISAGWLHVCALDSTGKAYCWGYNGDGEFGVSYVTESNVPLAVDASGVLAGKILTHITASDLDITSRTVHVAFTCALDTAGTAYCWGGNAYGELGDDSTTQSDTPILVGPQAPTNPVAVPGNTTATVSWTAGAWQGGGTLTGYTATALPGRETCATTGAITCAIGGLTDGTTYSITVVAHTTAGDSAGSTPAIVTPTSAGPIVSGYHKSVCIDDSNDSSANDAKIVTWKCNMSREQNWTIEADGTIRINGKCMDIYRDEKTSKAPVELWTCTGGDNQQWQARNGSLMNPVSRRCLDDPRFNTADGTELVIYTCNGGRNQQWILP